MIMTSPLDQARSIVVKTGSALIAEAGKPRTEWLAGLADDIAALRRAGRSVILVTSGAIALGRDDLGAQRPKRLEEKQAAAAFGQPRLMRALEAAFMPHDITVAQALLTLADTESRRRWLNARATLQTILAAGGLAVINENDTVATDEIRYGDNDRLAARVAQMMSADVLLLLSDVDGLYTADPRRDPDARHIPALDAVRAEHEALAGGINRAADLGSGGMATKLAAARIAHGAGCATAITRGDRLRPIEALAAGARATWILPELTPERARRAWLAGHLKPEGILHIDTGAAEALARRASLLPVGVRAVEGQFERGAAVAIHGPDNAVLAKGVTAYSARDIARIAGQRSEAAEALLGWRGRPAVVHRDDLVLTDPTS
jgi:glutamate 5-kinase